MTEIYTTITHSQHFSGVSRYSPVELEHKELHMYLGTTYLGR